MKRLLLAAVCHPVHKTRRVRIQHGTGARVHATPSVPTRHSLILANPGVSLLGGGWVERPDTNGWSCLRLAVSVLGGMRLQLQCRARLASATGGVTVWGGDHPAPGVAVMGTMSVPHVGGSGS